MKLTRRRTLALIGGGSIIAATASLGYAVTRPPQTAYQPWKDAGSYRDARMRALSWALLAPSPHNRQPWLARLEGDDTVVLHVDLERLLPQTDPYHRQILIGMGCFLELLRMAAAEDGYRVEVELFPIGSDATRLDDRPVARVVFIPQPQEVTDPFFAHVLARRSDKTPFDIDRPVSRDVIAQLEAAVSTGMRFGGAVDPSVVQPLRELTREALRIEAETPHTHHESVDLFRIGRAEIDANPDGISFGGPVFETLRMARLFTRDAAADPSHFIFRSGMDAVFANSDSAMGFVWLISDDNTRATQIAAGADWLRVNLAATAAGVGFHPLSQALQEFPEMAGPYATLHSTLTPEGGRVQMLARIGYGSQRGLSPRWPLDDRIMNV
ncbi:MAG: twin-arginine translocation pathway signal protein [Rhodobacteraceae bacterium]|nr:MAG: twin-arginine translocation pathway signal protein [Paracoccaceae bacterium]